MTNYWQERFCEFIWNEILSIAGRIKRDKELNINTWWLKGRIAIERVQLYHLRRMAKRYGFQNPYIHERYQRRNPKTLNEKARHIIQNIEGIVKS